MNINNQELNRLEAQFELEVKRYYESLLDDILYAHDLLFMPSDEITATKLTYQQYMEIVDAHALDIDSIFAAEEIEDEIIEKFGSEIACEIVERVFAPWEEKEAEIVRICVEDE